MSERSALELVKNLLQFTGVPFTEGHNTFDGIKEIYVMKLPTAADPEPEDCIVMGFDEVTGDEVSREYFP